MSRRINLLLTVFMAISLLASVSVLLARMSVEGSSNAVQLVLDYEDTKEYTSATGYPLSEFLTRMHEAGIGSIGLREARVRDLIEDGSAILLAGDGGSGRFIPNSLSQSLRTAINRALDQHYRSLLILPKEDWVIGFIKDLSTRLIGENVSSELVNDPSGARYVLATTAMPAKLSRQRYGLDRNKVTKVKALGFQVVPRFANFSGHSPTSIRTMLEQLQWIGDSSLVIFDGRDVLGYRRNLPVTADTLREHGSTLGLIELAVQRGEETLAEDMGFKAVRVHSVSAGEMQKMSRDDVVDRYVRAARERGVRVMYIRPFPERHDSVKLVNDSSAYAADLTKSLKAAGFKLGSAVSRKPLTTGMGILFAIALGVSSSAGLLLWHLTGVRPFHRLAVVALGLAAFGLLTASGHGILARQLMALLASLTVPTLAVVTQVGMARKGNERPSSRSHSIRRSFWFLCWTSILSAMGGFMVVGLLGDTRFLLKLQQFSGVKLMHVVPVMLVAYILYGGRERFRKPRELWQAIVAIYKGSVPVRFLVWLGVLGLMGLVYLARTGNESSIPVLGIEREFRAFLERVFIARPRSKEFLMAHPLEMLGFALLMGGYRQAAIPAIILGVIGQASIVNTFSHIHSPVVMAIARCGYAVVLGGILGALAIYAADMFLRKYRKVNEGICGVHRHENGKRRHKGARG